jgi:gas vesicle protein
MLSHSAGSWRLVTALVASATCLIWGTAPQSSKAAEPNPQELREKAERLQQEARELKAEGKMEQAQEALRKALELRREADHLREADGPAAGPGQPPLEELKQRLEQAKARLDEARADGKLEEATRLERQIARMEAVLERPDRPVPQRMRPPRGPLPEGGFPAAPPEQPEMRQLRHLEAAIQNLHAAGLHEPAERLSQQAREMRQKLGSTDRPEFAPRPPESELERLRMEVQELRERVRNLGARLDQLSRERP